MISAAPSQTFSIDTALAAYQRAQFEVNDILRRMQGDVISTFGLGADEHRYDVIHSGAHWRLRDYGARRSSRPVLVVAAPIKRPYIWDLARSASAIRYCLQQDLSVYLLEWIPASPRGENTGIDDCTKAIEICARMISDTRAGTKPFLIGHSLGGTLAAIFAATAPEQIQGLVLLCAPLCFRPGESQFRDALVSMLPPALSEAAPVPGSLLSHVSALASPDTFIWSRLTDAALSFSDPHALDIHARVERWALDEVPLPGRLVYQMVEWLYREDRFCSGLLPVHGRLVGPSNVSVPVLSVVNTADAIAPLASVKPFVDRVLTRDAKIMQYRGETGVALQHLGILIGRQAYAQVWPQIVSWLDARSQRVASPETAKGDPVNA
jgi:polyhydroxyalkanoate synthase